MDWSTSEYRYNQTHQKTWCGFEPHHAHRDNYTYTRLTPPGNHTTSTHDGPIQHDSLHLIDPVGASCTTLEHLIEALKAETPKAAARAIVPNVCWEMRQKVMLRPLQAGILRNCIESTAVLNDCVIQRISNVAPLTNNGWTAKGSLFVSQARDHKGVPIVGSDTKNDYKYTCTPASADFWWCVTVTVGSDRKHARL